MHGALITCRLGKHQDFSFMCKYRLSFSTETLRAWSHILYKPMQRKDALETLRIGWMRQEGATSCEICELLWQCDELGKDAW